MGSEARDDPRPFGDGMDKDVKSVALCLAMRIHN
ncbi:hypothetical protein T4D_7207 [Trichinella pseudospiralis]|uniref:Uncharacterized protein n=1 Tax=Trichinella pseudospiralis TaxID=6337 RepID=A0A0V1DL05_TRIPS|nr:hypothetical protein T4D_7207 [Trichinella pseudospiralis]